MGYRGKVEEQERARELRARNMTLQDIAIELGVAKSSVSLWVRDVQFTPSKRRTGAAPSPASIPRGEAGPDRAVRRGRHGANRDARARPPSSLPASRSTRAKDRRRDGAVKFANTDDRMMSFFCAWLRRFFDVDEARLRAQVYLHQGLDLDAAEAHWSRGHGHSPCAVPGAVPRRRRSEHPPEQARVRLCLRRAMAARRLIARSWGSSGRCYRRTPFRGSSTGRALGC